MQTLDLTDPEYQEYPYDGPPEIMEPPYGAPGEMEYPDEVNGYDVVPFMYDDGEHYVTGEAMNYA